MEKGKIQEKLRAEIHAVVGTERLPTMADQVKVWNGIYTFGITS